MWSLDGQNSFAHCNTEQVPNQPCYEHIHVHEIVIQQLFSTVNYFICLLNYS